MRGCRWAVEKGKQAVNKDWGHGEAMVMGSVEMMIHTMPSLNS